MTTSKQELIIEWKTYLFKIVLKNCLIIEKDRLGRFRKFILKLIKAYERSTTIDDLLILGIPKKILQVLVDQLIEGKFIIKDHNGYILTSRGERIDTEYIPRYKRSDFTMYIIMNPLFRFNRIDLLQLNISSRNFKKITKKVNSSEIEELINDKKLDIKDEILIEEKWEGLDILPITTCSLRVTNKNYKTVNISQENQEKRLPIELDGPVIRKLDDKMVFKVISAAIAKLIESYNSYTAANLEILDNIDVKNGIINFKIKDTTTLTLFKKMLEDSQIFGKKLSLWELIKRNHNNQLETLNLNIIKQYETDIFVNSEIINPKIIIPCRFIVTNKHIAKEIVENYLIEKIEKETSVFVNPKPYLNDLAHRYWEEANLSKFGELDIEINDKWLSNLAQEAYEMKLFNAYKWITVGRDFNE